MIGQLRGTLIEKQPPALVIDVQGVGYEVDVPMSTFYRLPETGQSVLLYTHLIVREDAHHLYGFDSREEQQLFRILLKVNGVGPRLALTILSRMNPNDFVRCVANNDTDSLLSLPGIGTKTAGRLMIELRDRLSHWQSADVPQGAATDDSRKTILQDAISALIALGYKSQDATRVITRLDDGQIAREEMIRRALQIGLA